MVRVDTVPILLRPVFLLYGYTLGFLVYCLCRFTYATCTITFKGANLQQYPHHVLCIWHESLIAYFNVFNRVDRQVWMNHPAWYMKPIHVLLKLCGVEHICLGSSGNSGKEALANVIGYLKQGYSTLVACDGPAGPNHELKPGVLLMSRHAQIPVIPLRFVCTKSFRLPGWDKKMAVLPFSKITVEAGEPVYVTDENMEQSAKQISDWLNFNV